MDGLGIQDWASGKTTFWGWFNSPVDPINTYDWSEKPAIPHILGGAYTDIIQPVAGTPSLGDLGTSIKWAGVGLGAIALIVLLVAVKN